VIRTLNSRSGSSYLFLPPTNGRQCSLAQYIRIAFACLGKLNDLDGDGLSDTIVTVASPQSNAGHFEGDAKDPRSLLVEPLTIKKWGDGHGSLPSFRWEHDRSLSHRPGFEASAFVAIGAPKNTPIEIIGRLNHEMNAGLADPKVKARLTEVGGTAFVGSPADFSKFIGDETEKWGKVIRAANIKPE
jgi:Tripartite tricarboxylate transporter family receptor